MAQDTVDAAVLCNEVGQRKRSPSIEVLHSEMPGRYRKDRGKKVVKTILNTLRLRKSASAEISRPDPTYKVAYLGNVVTGWAKGDGCVEKPLATLWRNYTQSSRPDVRMELTVSGGGLKATTRDHGLTEYWAHRLTCCAAPSHFPRLFCWVYRHEGRRLRHELRCHAVLCSSVAVARQIETQLKNSLHQALLDFKRDKINRQNARLSLVNSVYENPTMPRRKILLSTGSNNYRPPLERSKSAPKLTIIEENLEEDEEIFEGRPRNLLKPNKIFRQYESSSALLDNRGRFMAKLSDARKCSARNKRILNSVPAKNNSSVCDENDNKIGSEKHKSVHKVKFVDEPQQFNFCADDNTLVIEQLVDDNFASELIESFNENMERTWFGNLTENADLLPDSDEGSLSSGCESASTVTSDLEQPPFTTIAENDEVISLESPPEMEDSGKDRKKTDFDFKVGYSVLSRVRSFERLTSSDVHKYCGLNAAILNNDQISLVPLGESQADFSSLKVFKKRHSESGVTISSYDNHKQIGVSEDDDNKSVCSDEGYDEELDCVSSVANIVLV